MDVGAAAVLADRLALDSIWVAPTVVMDVGSRIFLNKLLSFNLMVAKVFSDFYICNKHSENLSRNDNLIYHIVLNAQL
ncbi:hypothetical protein B7P43_G02351 [Cryptotermes secundus]|uniref:Uncharacterized protein n=1 Tax=Cryptotermes secundus TaxID=105785 RepID=A0A2J7RB35_9NEOP|nr:hypothetical protein B7P43_G02351 [Cryptotermes secundus]